MHRLAARRDGRDSESRDRQTDRQDGNGSSELAPARAARLSASCCCYITLHPVVLRYRSVVTLHHVPFHYVTHRPARPAICQNSSTRSQRWPFEPGSSSGLSSCVKTTVRAGMFTPTASVSFPGGRDGSGGDAVTLRGERTRTSFRTTPVHLQPRVVPLVRDREGNRSPARIPQKASFCDTPSWLVRTLGPRYGSITIRRSAHYMTHYSTSHHIT